MDCQLALLAQCASGFFGEAKKARQDACQPVLSSVRSVPLSRHSVQMEHPNGESLPLSADHGGANPARGAPFANVPPDLLRLITILLTGIDITCLYLCGNSALNDALGRRGGVLEFRAEVAPSTKLCFPTVLYNFAHLQVLHFSLKDTSLLNIRIGPFDVTRLPRTLQSLKLPFPDTWISFFRQLRKEGELSGHLQPYHLASLFPDLRKIKLHRNRTVRSLCDPRFLAVLPRSIERYFMASTFALTELKSLPVALQHLEFAFSKATRDWNWEHDPHLPPNLTRLSIENCPSPCILNFLPPYIRRLSLSYLPSTLKTMQTSENNWNLLPRNLEFLEISTPRVTLAMLDSLPPDLLTLRINSSFKMDILPEDLRHLPRSLTEAEVDFMMTPKRRDNPALWPDDGESPYLTNLPPGLKRIPIPVPVLVTPALLRSLPSGLESFEIAHYSWRSPTFGTEFGMDLIPILPSSLTALWIDFSQAVGAQQKMDLTLPPNLIRVSIYRAPASFVSALSALRHLKTLIANHFQSVKDRTLPTLETLTLADPVLSLSQLGILTSATTSLTQLSIERLRTIPTRDFFLTQLPSTIQVLELTHALPAPWPPSKLLTAGTFANLKQLQKLQMGSFEASLGDEHLGHFPSSLYDLAISGDSIRLTQAGIDALPKRLVRLTLPKPKKPGVTFDTRALPNLANSLLSNSDSQVNYATHDILANMDLVEHDWQPS